MADDAARIAERILILAPIGRDAQAAAQHLMQSGLVCVVCDEIDDLLVKLKEGGAAALVTEEAFSRHGTAPVEQWVSGQPAWSDFPFIVLTTRTSSARAHAHRLCLLESLGNVSLLERPLNAVTLISAVQSAVRARRRQYEVRAHLLERDVSAAHLEDLVRHRTHQLVRANEQLQQEISERREVEAALQQAQKMEVIGQMTGGVAHDFNNLLTAVLGNLELALRRGCDERIRRYLEGATQAAQRGARLTAQLLAFSRTQRMQVQVIDINSVVTNMREILSRTIGGTVRIETNLGENVWRAAADPSQIESVILNLAVNARDAMPDGGRLTISTCNVPQHDKSKPRELAEGEYVMISVTDTGTGMTDEVLRKAFEPFFTTKPVGSGTGLGLSQVYGITKQTGGTVSITSRLEQGTTVSIYLPRSTKLPLLPASASPAESSLTWHDATILVVDDDRDVRQIASSFLESLGYRVLAVEGGQAAVDTISHGTEVDLVLMDVAMPELNGVEAMQAILAKRPDLPFVYMTGYIGPTKLDPTEQRVLKKPFSITELAAKVEEALVPDIRRPRDNVVAVTPAR
ncbi:MAG: response regulator [Hyphomicrobiales bacterium]|nr:response regulator [Hyphomicrobiales bacterium]